VVVVLQEEHIFHSPKEVGVRKEVHSLGWMELLLLLMWLRLVMVAKKAEMSLMFRRIDAHKESI
jgi:hypothetical protein